MEHVAKDLTPAILFFFATSVFSIYKRSEQASKITYNINNNNNNGHLSRPPSGEPGAFTIQINHTNAYMHTHTYIYVYIYKWKDR